MKQLIATLLTILLLSLTATAAQPQPRRSKWRKAAVVAAGVAAGGLAAGLAARGGTSYPRATSGPARPAGGQR